VWEESDRARVRKSVGGDIYILGSRVSPKIKIQSETRDFNFWGHSGTQYIYMPSCGAGAHARVVV
jgi:hypothetical protein